MRSVISFNEDNKGEVISGTCRREIENKNSQKISSNTRLDEKVLPVVKQQELIF